MAESESIDVEEDGVNAQNYSSIQTWTNRFTQKVTLERIILVTNTIIELPSAVFDQLSSVHQPKYALLSMLMSFTVFLLSIIDLVYKGRRESVRLKIKGLIPWFYYPYPNSKPFGRFPEIIGLICAFSQCIFASIAYCYLNRHANNPVNLNVWPLVFALGLLCSRFSENGSERRLTHVMRRKRYRDVFVADVISSERFVHPPLVRGLSI